MKKILILLFIIGLFSSCDLDRTPYNAYTQEDVLKDRENSLNILLNGCYAQMKDWADVMHRVGEYSADNVMIRGASTDAFFQFISYNHTTVNGRLSTFWNNSYKVISQSSEVMKMAKEGESAALDQKLGEAYYLRGLMYFYLCRAFGRPYYQSPETNLGVPIVNGMPADLNNINLPDRSTVKATYEQAIADLKKAEGLMTINRPASYASKEAAQAMLCRIYLFMSGTYDNPNVEYADKAIEYAKLVEQSGRYRLLLRDNFMKYNTFSPDADAQTETIFAVKRVDSEYSGSDYYYNIGGMYSNIQEMGWGEMYASAKYLNLLRESGAQNDARWAFIDPQFEEDKDKKKTDAFIFVAPQYTFVPGKPTVQNGYKYIQAILKKNTDGSLKLPLETDITEQIDSKYEDKDGKQVVVPITETKTYVLQTIEDGYYYSINFYGVTYTGEKSYLMILNRAFPMFYITKCSLQDYKAQLHSPIISRLAELYLNMAEAYAKKGDYANAKTYLNLVRERSIIGGAYSSLDATNAFDRIDKERQLELAFEAHRGFDVYRNGQTMSRQYPGAHDNLKDILPTDPRVVYYIPQAEINSYVGTLTQNP